MDYTALEKFIERMDIEILYNIDRAFITSTGRRYICVEVRAYYKKKETYNYYHCWEFTNQGLAEYDDGNQVMGVRDGVFAYIGDDYMVDFYFRNKALDLAKKYFEKSK